MQGHLGLLCFYFAGHQFASQFVTGRSVWALIRVGSGLQIEGVD